MENYLIEKRRDQNLLVALVCAGAFIANLDSTIVNIALPTLSSEFSVSPSVVSWTILAYLLCETGFMLPFGKLSDIKGIKDEFFVIVPDDEHEGCFLPYLYVQLKDGYTLDDVRDKINACLPERYMRPVEIFTVPERPFFHFKTNRIGLSKEIIAKRNQQKEKAKRNSFADGCIA